MGCLGALGVSSAAHRARPSRLVAGKTGTDRLARGLDSFHQQSAHRFDTYSGESASAQPTGSGRRNAARVGCTGHKTWLGYRTHLTETCEADLPEVIVQVQTTQAPLNDVEHLLPIQRDLLEAGLQPREHLVDQAIWTVNRCWRARRWASRCTDRL